MKNIPCNLCEGYESTLLYSLTDLRIRSNDKKEFHIVRCNGCKLAYLNPQPQWDELEYYYGNHAYGGSNNLVSNYSKKIRALFPHKPKFLNFGKQSGRLLNIGCDTGSYEESLIPHYPKWEFYGIEPGKEAAKIARGIAGLHFTQGELDGSTFKKDFFDVILLNHVFEHLPNPMETLKICNAILKPGGHIVIAVPNFNGISRIIFGNTWLPLEVPRHLFHFSSKTIKEILGKTNFTDIKIKFESAPGTVIMSMGYNFEGTKNFIKRNKILWPFFALLFAIIPIITTPARKISDLLHISGGMRISAKK